MTTNSNFNLPAKYWRKNKDWARLLGETGVVIASTAIRITSPQYKQFVPYDLAIINVGSQKLELMACHGQKLTKGDRVRLVLRKAAAGSSSGLIDYQLKLNKI